MSDGALRKLAARAGVLPRWRDAFNRDQDVSPEVLRDVLARIGVPAATDADIAEGENRLAEASAAGHAPLVTTDQGAPTRLAGRDGRCRVDLDGGGMSDEMIEDGFLPALDTPGYHRLALPDGTETILAVAPRSCFALDPALRPWGLAVQLYALRRDGDGGIGDFPALAEMARAAGRRGASALAISPVHAQFSADPDRFGPYAPSSRIMLNVLHAPVPPGAPPRDAGDALLVDWPAAGRARLAAFRTAFDADPDPPGFAAFRTGLGDALESHARFEALHERFFHADPTCWHWRTWPEAYRDPGSPAIAAFARDNARDVAFHAWMQWRADMALADAQAAARDAGMAVGLITDLAVGTDSGGSHTWSRQDQVLTGLTVGAPPDLLSRDGQNWGIVAFSPLGLRAHGFAAFLEMLRAALRHAGGVRIDHVMGLARLWVVPEGADASHGAYLTMPRDDLLRLVALESQRHRAIVLGEDLGTLPDGFQEALDARALRGLRVLWFERALDLGFVAPRDWSAGAVAMTSTHDLPTVAGWWTGHDIDLRARLGHTRDEVAERSGRVEDRARLWSAMRASGAAPGDLPDADDAAPVVDAAVAHVGRAASGMVILPIEDALGTVEQPNLPGTTDQHPNWRRRLPSAAEPLLARPDVARRLKTLRELRTAVS